MYLVRKSEQTGEAAQLIGKLNEDPRKKGHDDRPILEILLGETKREIGEEVESD